MINIKDLTLNTPVYNYYYGQGRISEIENNRISVEFECKFLKGNKFTLVFITDGNVYYEKDRRHIKELSLTDYEKIN